MNDSERHMTDDERRGHESVPIDDLPDLSDAAVARIESSVFAQIAAESHPETAGSAPARDRRRRWLTGMGIAAAFVVGVLVTPPILGIVGGSATSDAGGGELPAGVAIEDARAGSADQSAPESGSDLSAESSSVLPGTADSAEREIIATANATVRVEDIAEAAAEITAVAETHGGYVEGTEIGGSTAGDGSSEPAPSESGYGWISIRVPSADLASVIDELADSGEVLSSSTSKQDVTATAIDLRARVDATRASVQRLTELMSQTGTVAELIEAEVALTDRQALLESYEQQLAGLEDQVAMSTLQVQLTRTTPPTTADPAGFTDGLTAGWNGLVASLNALVVAIGFVLPWIALAGAVVLVIWLIRRARRTRRSLEEPPVDN
ncbi:DUF4349 domain-containing protein [Microbacterium sp. C5A9]|uniref:DUF4349 domain-containing protein n=1 Tax=Microbacterium sp. C5A9 TaxID=2736663 RepID=UPI001F51DB29|nr:DUF4349 domain-containing protein [Microbacterium sp. C5A9]MCI1017905.1 DUF4349 domain-containing protein [Microbacterium sp. C5A9]